MREKNRKSIASSLKFPQFTTMNVIDGQAGLIIYASLIFYSLTVDNILNIIILLILAGVAIVSLTGENGILERARLAKERTSEATEDENEKLTGYENEIDKMLENRAVTEEQLEEILSAKYQRLRSDNYEEVTYNGTYTAPCDGYYCSMFHNSAYEMWGSGVYHYSSNGTLLSYVPSCSYGWSYSGCELYMKQGEKITFVRHSTNVVIDSSKFFYAVGCQPDSNQE